VKTIARHIDRLSAAFAVFFFLANAGLTIVVDRCASEGTMVCASQSYVTHQSCDAGGTAMSSSRPGSRLSADNSCCGVSLVGGVNTSPMVSESSAAVRIVRQPVLVSATLWVPLTGGVAYAIQDTNLFRNSLALIHGAREKYVLFESFLI
jgi:hypothetical protein